MFKKHINKKLTSIYKNATKIKLTNKDKYIIFSDFHIGNGSRMDDFAHNENIVSSILSNYYLKKNYTPDYVLCLYYKDGTRKHELASKYQNREGIKYRFWKSDEATLKGEYSEEFLQALSPERRNLFTKRKR